MGVAVFDNMAAADPADVKDSFVVGIIDDVGFSSLPYGAELDDALPESTTECLFWCAPPPCLLACLRRARARGLAPLSQLRLRGLQGSARRASSPTPAVVNSRCAAGAWAPTALWAPTRRPSRSSPVSPACTRRCVGRFWTSHAVGQWRSSPRQTQHPATCPFAALTCLRCPHPTNPPSHLLRRSGDAPPPPVGAIKGL